MLKAFSLTAFLVAAALPFGAAEMTLQERPVPLMTPLEHVRDPLRQALSALSHAANQTCDVKEAIRDIKGALNDIAAGEALLARDAYAAALPPLPSDVTPDFTPPPRPAPRRNEMLEGGLKGRSRVRAHRGRRWLKLGAVGSRWAQFGHSSSRQLSPTTLVFNHSAPRPQGLTTHP
jgi:hypothetical protein